MKTLTKAYLLYFFFGMIGAHRFYTGKTKSAWFMVSFVVGGFLTGGFTWIVLTLWALLDVFCVPEMVRQANRTNPAVLFRGYSQ